MMQYTRVIVAVLVLGIARSAWGQAPWDNDVNPVVDRDRPPAWTVELKVGPYHPNIDASFGLPPGEGPYDFVYGARSMPLVLVELDRYFLTPAGQLGISLAAGYSYRTGSGFEVDANGELLRDADGELLRYSGYRTVFRIYPLATGVVYRFTWLDDHVRVPVVPYAKLGLAAYVWQFLRPAQNVEGVSENPACSTGPCLADRTNGTTLGWQWTLGLSLRLSRFDHQSALALRDSGIRHAGVFFEVVGARVDDFGAKDALDVGDTTWFAGMNMEF